MRALKTGEDIYLLKMEYILFLLLNGNVSAWFILFISNGVHMSLSSICLRTLEGAYIQSII